VAASSRAHRIVKYDFYVGNKLNIYSVTVRPDGASGNFFAEFKGPSIDSGPVIKIASREALRSLNSSLNTAIAASLAFPESGQRAFLKLFNDAVASPDLDQFESERKTKEGRGFR
jgi:hypothetical protein